MLKVEEVLQERKDGEGGGASAVHYDCRVICHVNGRTLKFSCQLVARVKHSPNQAKQRVKLTRWRDQLPASTC
jgi:hypothetical protein